MREKDSSQLEETSLHMPGSISSDDENLNAAFQRLSQENAFVQKQMDKLYHVVKQLWDAVQAQLIHLQDSDRALRQEVREELRKFQLDGPQRAMTGVIGKLFRDLIQHVDELDGLVAIAESNEEKLGSSWVDSIRVARDGYEVVLRDWGCTTIHVDVGAERFDPNRHEAVEAEPGEISESAREDLVVKVRRRGWQLHGQTLRCPQVVVS